MKVIGYVRVSTSKQADSGLSLESQEIKIREWAAKAGHELVEIIQETRSGKDTKRRPGFMRALDECCAHRYVFVVCKLDRFARSTIDALQCADRLRKAGAELVVIDQNIDTTTAAGKLLFGIFAAFAEFERDIIRDRTQSAMDRKRQRGEALGNVPYGMKRSGTQLVANVEERAIIDMISRLRAQGKPVRAIARGMNQVGHVTRSGGKWTPTQVQRVLSRSDGGK